MVVGGAFLARGGAGEWAWVIQPLFLEQCSHGTKGVF